MFGTRDGQRWLALAIVLAAAVSACSPLTLTPGPTTVAGAPATVAAPTTVADPTPTPSLDALGAFEGDPCTIIESAVRDYFEPFGATAAFARAGSGPFDTNTCEVTITREDGSTWVFTAQALQFPGVAAADYYFEVAYLGEFGGSGVNFLGDAGLITVDPIAFTARVAVRSGAWVIILADLNAERTGDEYADDISINDSVRAFIDLLGPIVEGLG